MENNEIMYEDIEIVDDAVVADEKPGMGAGVAMLIGAGVTLAVGAGVKLVKKAIAKHKAKKALRQPDDEVYVEDEDIEEVAAK